MTINDRVIQDQVLSTKELKEAGEACTLIINWFEVLVLGDKCQYSENF